MSYQNDYSKHLLQLSQIPHLSLVVVAAALVSLVYLIYTTCFATDVPYIKGIPEIPGAVPVFGHLLKLGDDHASVCEAWWRQYNQSVFQIKLGNTRAVVVNSFEDCKNMLLGQHNQNAIIDRPKLYTFHGVISSTQGFTIGSSPWDESCKKKRKAAGTALGRPALRSYYPMFDLESYCIVRDFHKNQSGELSVRPFIQRYALNTTLTLCYGIRMDDVYDDLLREVLHVGSAISLLRSASENLQDYIPILRYFPNEKNGRSKDLRKRRDAYLNLLLDKVREMIKNGTDKPCISAAILKDQETKLSGVEVSSICLSLVSGGFETIPGTLTSAIGSLSTKEGQEWQDRAYEDIKRCYDDDIGAAWTDCFVQEKVPYINAIVKEAGRYYTVSSMSLPRKTVTEVNWNGAIIPAKTMILINAQAGNHDIDHYGSTGSTFNPERWLSSLSPPTENDNPGLPHLSFGAGSRGCSGQFIAQRLLYSALVRILSMYKIVASETEPPNTDYVEYNQFKTALVAIPKDFKVKLVPRNEAVNASVLREAEERTKEYYKAEK